VNDVSSVTMLEHKDLNVPEHVDPADDSDSGLDEDELEALVAADAAADDDDTSDDEEEAEEEEEEIIEEVEIEDLRTVMGNTSRQPKPVPSSIPLEVSAVDLSCHPKEDLLAVANLDGELLLYTFSCEEENELVHTVDVHKKACRVVQFTDDGSAIYTASKTGQVILTDTETKQQKHKMNHHKCPIYCLVNINSNVIATGDDDGNIKLCDVRQKSAVATWETMDDYIAALVTNEDRKTLVAASGGGVISSYSIGNRKPLFESDHSDGGGH